MGMHFTTLYKFTEPHYMEGSPVIIEAGTLLKCDETGDLLGQLKLININQKMIRAVSVELDLLDTANRPLGIKVPFQYLDLAAERDAEFAQKVPVPITSLTAQSYIVSITEVIFSDSTIWTPTKSDWSIIQGPQPLWDLLSDYELEKQYQMEYGEKSTHCFAKENDLWYCSCGAINHSNELHCHSCNLEQATQRSLNLQELKQKCTSRLAAEEAKARQQEEALKLKELQEEQQKSNIKKAKAEARRAKKDARIMEKAARKQHREENEKGTEKYEQAQETIEGTNILYGEGTNKHEDNSSILQGPEKYITEEVSVDNDKAEKANRAPKTAKIFITIAICLVVLAAGTLLFIRFGMPFIQYKQAENHFANAEYAEAQVIFQKLGDYKDSPSMQIESGYQQAKANMEAGNYELAEEWLRNHNDYKDAKQLLVPCLYGEAESLIGKGKYLTSEAIICGNDLADTEEGKKILNTINYLQAMEYKEKGDAASYCKALLNVNIENGFIDNATYQEAEKELNSLEESGVAINFKAGFRDGIDIKVIGVSAKKNTNGMEIIVAYEAGGNVEAAYFNPPHANIVQGWAYGGAGENKMHINLSRQAINSITELTLNVWVGPTTPRPVEGQIYLDSIAINTIRSLMLST